MTDLEMLKAGVRALDSKKAHDIKIIKVKDLTILANYFVIAAGTSTTQVKALADEVDYQLGLLGEQPKQIEGKQSSSWVVLDYIDVIFHVFYKDTREFYDLERLWQDGEIIDIQQFLDED